MGSGTARGGTEGGSTEHDVATPAFPVGSPTHVALYDGDGGVYTHGGQPHEPPPDGLPNHQPTPPLRRRLNGGDNSRPVTAWV